MMTLGGFKGANSGTSSQEPTHMGAADWIANDIELVPLAKQNTGRVRPNFTWTMTQARDEANTRGSSGKEG